jgi:hypothetical protein
LECLLKKEKNPDFDSRWLILNAPKAEEKEGFYFNKIRAKFVEEN